VKNVNIRGGREMKKGKRIWSKPELIVLVRNRPEEAVLLACKGDYVYGVGVSSGCRDWDYNGEDPANWKLIDCFTHVIS
jgi:hypothetical protein